ncbi:hypothetical protein NL676_021601 [Syzygium grande]|nr:hypothetical protein NL676_021601 [Syzygium grande]
MAAMLPKVQDQEASSKLDSARRHFNGGRSFDLRRDRISLERHLLVLHDVGAIMRSSDTRPLQRQMNNRHDERMMKRENLSLFLSISTEGVETVPLFRLLWPFPLLSIVAVYVSSVAFPTESCTASIPAESSLDSHQAEALGFLFLQDIRVMICEFRKPLAIELSRAPYTTSHPSSLIRKL